MKRYFNNYTICLNFFIKKKLLNKLFDIISFNYATFVKCSAKYFLRDLEVVCMLNDLQIRSCSRKIP